MISRNPSSLSDANQPPAKSARATTWPDSLGTQGMVVGWLALTGIGGAGQDGMRRNQ